MKKYLSRLTKLGLSTLLILGLSLFLQLSFASSVQAAPSAETIRTCYDDYNGHGTGSGTDNKLNLADYNASGCSDSKGVPCHFSGAVKNVTCIPPCPKTSVIPLEGDCNATTVAGNPIFKLLVYFIRFLSVGVGLAVAGGIIWGGILYGTARGNAAQTQKGVIVIVNAVVGLILYLFMFALLNFFIPGGIFS